MGKKEIIEKVVEKKDFSMLPVKDVEKAFSHFEKREVSDEEKVRLTRELLHKVFGAFTSRKLLSPKDKDAEWILRKHLSTRERMSVPSSSKRGQTRERLGFYEKVYKRVLKGLEGKTSVVDFGAGVNGFSYPYFEKAGFDVSYTAVESVGQLVNLMNSFFERSKIQAEAVHMSLFELNKVKSLLKGLGRRQARPRVVFLFKVLDSLEMMEKDYSKKLILGITPCSERIVLSFATESMNKRKKFNVSRKWIFDFIKENFSVLDEFEIGSEKFVVFEKRKKR
ncbi:MAG: hypothetical protein KJ879_00815 [Nanoarchaeota archaeon]|nr:hypothetical protein [Nanoarchaeota archaeon]